jgi:serine protease Do
MPEYRARGVTTSAVVLLSATIGWMVLWVGEVSGGMRLSDLSDASEALVESVSPAVVQIVASGYAPAPSAPGAPPDDGQIARRHAGGSGFIVDPSGFVLTNAHVIEGAEHVRVVLASSVDADPGLRSIVRPRGREMAAEIVGVDRETDLAVLHIAERNLPALPFGDSDRLRRGEIVFAFGSPLGLEESVTMGVVSALGRQRGLEDPMVFIQTDAPINPGNSGGPLIDTAGGVMGVNTFILSQSGGSEGLGFAVPSNIARTVFEQIRKSGRVQRGKIGVHPQTLTPRLARALGLETDGGVVLGDVEPGGPADSAGLQIGDVVVTLDGKPMENGRQLGVNLYRHSPGDIVELEILRDGKRRKEFVAVQLREDGEERFDRLVSPEKNLVPELGVFAVEIEKDVEAMLPPLRKSGGLVVAGRVGSAPLSELPLAPGDVIFEVDGKSVSDLAGLRSALAKVGEVGLLQIQRGGVLSYVAFEPNEQLR